MSEHFNIANLNYGTPQTTEQKHAYYQLRWQILRQPWQQPKGSEQDNLEQESFHRMITDENGDVVAVVRLHIAADNTGIVRYMAVVDEMQGKGVGKYLLTCLENEMQKYGVVKIELNARDNAIAFYQSMQYQLGEFSHNLYGEIPHYKMYKMLAPHIAPTLSELNAIWHNTIPVSQFMGIKGCYYDQDKLIVTADVSPNKNLHNTMFAGSIYTLATLTGWGWTHLKMQQAEISGDIVLADAHIRYLSPVNNQAYGLTNFSQIKGKLNPVGQRKSRLEVMVEIKQGDTVCALFTGVFVIVPTKTEDVIHG